MESTVRDAAAVLCTDGAEMRVRGLLWHLPDGQTEFRYRERELDDSETVLRFGGGHAEMLRTGAYTAEMRFGCPGVQPLRYSTPYGILTGQLRTDLCRTEALCAELRYRIRWADGPWEPHTMTVRITR